jgi:hypothetical protein
MPGEVQRFTPPSQSPMPYTPGRSVERSLKRQSAEVARTAIITGQKVQATFRLGRLVMDETVELDRSRQELAGNDPGLNALLCNIEASTIQEAQRIQRNAFR